MALFSERLRALRLEKGELQADVAKMLDVSLGSYSAYESGREPKYDILCKLANHYGVTTDFLTGHSAARSAENTNVSEMLGLTEQAIESLKDCYRRDKANSITLTVNALLEHRFALGEISHYLFYDLQNLDDDTQRLIHSASYRYIAKCKPSFGLWDEIKDSPPVDFEMSLNVINNDMYKRLQLTRVDEQLMKLLEIEEKRDRF